MLKFLNNHYEKIVLFISLLILIVFLWSLSGDITEIRLRTQNLRGKVSDIGPSNSLKLLPDSIFKNDDVFRKETFWGFEGKDLFEFDAFAICMNSECNKVIRLDSDECIFCDATQEKSDLKPEVDRTLAKSTDTDKDGYSDKEEKKLGMDMNNPYDKFLDFDMDGFFNDEEYRYRPSTNMKDPKSHPPLARLLKVKSILSRSLGIIFKSLTRDKEDKKTWIVALNVFGRRNRHKTKFLHIGDSVVVREIKFIIKDILFKEREYKDLKTNSVRKIDDTSLVLTKIERIRGKKVVEDITMKRNKTSSDSGKKITLFYMNKPIPRLWRKIYLIDGDKFKLSVKSEGRVVSEESYILDAIISNKGVRVKKLDTNKSYFIPLFNSRKDLKKFRNFIKASKVTKELKSRSKMQQFRGNIGINPLELMNRRKNR